MIAVVDYGVGNLFSLRSSRIRWQISCLCSSLIIRLVFCLMGISPLSSGFHFL